MFLLQATSKISTSQTNRLKSHTKAETTEERTRQECEGVAKDNTGRYKQDAGVKMGWK